MGCAVLRGRMGGYGATRDRALACTARCLPASLLGYVRSSPSCSLLLPYCLTRASSLVRAAPLPLPPPSRTSSLPRVLESEKRSERESERARERERESQREGMRKRARERERARKREREGSQRNVSIHNSASVLLPSPPSPPPASPLILPAVSPAAAALAMPVRRR
eukprot:83428-Rhodomonas_salina.1